MGIHLGNLPDSCRSDKYVTDAVLTIYSRFTSLLFKFHSSTSEFKTYCMCGIVWVYIMEF